MHAVLRVIMLLGLLEEDPESDGEIVGALPARIS